LCKCGTRRSDAAVWEEQQPHFHIHRIHHDIVLFSKASCTGRNEVREDLITFEELDLETHRRVAMEQEENLAGLKRTRAGPFKT
jgi:hypothetical protein